MGQQQVDGVGSDADCLAEGAYIALARGCDFEDAALERGIFLGSAQQFVQSSAVVEFDEER